MIRIHRVLRQQLFLPLSTTGPPVPLAALQPQRRTTMKLTDGARRVHEDDWQRGGVERKMDFTWTGATEFVVKPGYLGEQVKEEPQEHPRESHDVKMEPQDEDSLQEYEPSPHGPPALEQYDPQQSAVPLASENEQVERSRERPKEGTPNLLERPREGLVEVLQKVAPAPGPRLACWPGSRAFSQLSHAPSAQRIRNSSWLSWRLAPTLGVLGRCGRRRGPCCPSPALVLGLGLDEVHLHPLLSAL